MYVLVSGDHVLDAQKAFVSINIINILNWTGALLPMEISFAVQVSDVSPSWRRLISCLNHGRYGLCLSKMEVGEGTDTHEIKWGPD